MTWAVANGIGPDAAVGLVDRNSCTVAVSGPGKWTYVIGALDPEQHADDVVRFARLHHAHDEGLPVWRERPVHIRKNTIARVLPLAT